MAGHYHDTILDQVTGKPVKGAQVRVYQAGATIVSRNVTSGTFATIFSDDGVTQIDQTDSDQIITTLENGWFEFWTNETSVVLDIDYGGANRWAVDDVEILGGSTNSDLSALAARVDKHDTVFGLAANATDLGTFTGSTISDNTDVVTALQELETQVESGAATGDITASGLTMSTNRLLGRTTASTGAIEEITVGSGLTFASGSLSASQPYAQNENWTFNFSDAADALIYADVAMTVTQQATSGTGTIAYEKSTAAAPSTFASTSSPITLEAGAWLKVLATSVTAPYAVHLKRTA